MVGPDLILLQSHNTKIIDGWNLLTIKDLSLHIKINIKITNNFEDYKFYLKLQ